MGAKKWFALLDGVGKKCARKGLAGDGRRLFFEGMSERRFPFSAIRGMEAKDGELRLKTDEGQVVFELGERAEKWREKIANPKPVVEKLGVKPGEPVAVFGKLDGEFF